MNGPRRIGDIIKEQNIILKGADVATQRGWTGVPNFMLENADLSIGAKLCYAMLLKYCHDNDYCFPGQQRLAGDIGSSLNSVNTYIKELRRKGYISVERRGQGKTNLYTVYLKASFWKKRAKAR